MTVFSKTHRDLKTSQIQFPWLGPGFSKCMVLVSGPSILLRSFLVIISLPNTPGGASFNHPVYYFGNGSLSLIMFKSLLHDIYLIVVNSNILTYYYETGIIYYC